MACGSRTPLQWGSDAEWSFATAAGGTASSPALIGGARSAGEGETMTGGVPSDPPLADGCGDGITGPLEECDDGNGSDADGCSSVCRIESGYHCANHYPDGSYHLPATYRDFPATAADFEMGVTGLFMATQGLVLPELDAEGKPERTSSVSRLINSADSFKDWYRDVEGVNTTAQSVLVLWPNDEGGFVNRSTAAGEQYNWLDGDPTFFPLDGLPDMITPAEELAPALIPPPYSTGWAAEPSGELHNFHFTSEIRFVFSFESARAPFRIDLLGDDDVWVFLDGTLVVDMGGIHTPVQAELTLDENGIATTIVSAPTSPTIEPVTAVRPLDVLDGNEYEIAVFHAERQKDASSLKLGLSGFALESSRCIP